MAWACSEDTSERPVTNMNPIGAGQNGSDAGMDAGSDGEQMPPERQPDGGGPEPEPTDPDAGPGEACDAALPSGTYFMSIYTALQKNAKRPPIFLRVSATPDGERVDFSFQPLKTDADAADPAQPARADARVPVGEAIVANDIAVRVDGTFTIDVKEIVVPGQANPISGSDIEGDLVLEGRLCGVETLCGTLKMQLRKPLMGPAPGTWGTDPLPSGAEPTDITEPSVECNLLVDPCAAPGACTCEDGTQNQGEEGVDCGGPCDACATCDDGAQNQGEEGVDCGGPCVATCATCDDGARNQGEEGIDCGGPCDAVCATCWDRVQNQGEAGVDCGGPCGDCLAAGACNDPASDACKACASDKSSCDGNCNLWCAINPLCNQTSCLADCTTEYASCAGEAPSCSDGIANQGEERVDCGGPCLSCDAVWPPPKDSLFSSDGGPHCTLPACDEQGDNGLGDTSGTWKRTLRNTRSTCADAIVNNNALAGQGAEQVDEIELKNLFGQCERDNAADAARHTATVKEGIFAACDSNPRSFGIVSYEVSILTFDTAAGTGTGNTTVYVTGVPGWLASDCDFDLEVTYERL